MGDTVFFREITMGGRALARFGLSTQRLPASAFHALSASVQQAFSERFPDVRICAIPAYREKEDFGDLDLLVALEPLTASGGVEALCAWSQEAGNSRGQDHNESVLSVEWRSDPCQENGFQVDFIAVPKEEFDVALDYFSYNDLGNLVGRIAHKMGLLHGHQGLLMPIRDDTHELTRLRICSDTSRTLSFLGYDPVRFREGFANLREIFEFVASSPYFNKEIFLLENRNHASRTRDKKRKTYREFLQWMDQQEGLPAFPFPEDKKQWLPSIFAAFPGCKEAYDGAWARLEKQRRLSAQFNGEKVGAMTGLAGKELGGVMRQLRLLMSDDEILAVLDKDGLNGLRPAIDRAVSVARSSPRGP